MTDPIEKQRVYGPEQPGVYPFTRGIHPTMYRERLWSMRQYAGFGTAAESNRRYRYLLEQGQTGLSVAFDLPTQMGFDSDAPRALGEVGRVGVAIDSVRDMEALFDGIRLEAVSTSMTINATAATLLAFYLVVAERQGVSPKGLRGTVQNDILKEYIARGTYIYPPKPSLRLVTDLVAFCAQEMPQWNTISVSGYHIREAGSTAVQEIAFTLADGLTYVAAAIERGLAVDTFAPRLSFFFNVQSDFFEEVAKFRAARRLWARLMRERFDAQDPKSMMLRFHAQTAGSSLTAQQPENNITRVALQAFAAVLGGTQSLHTNSMDEALALPSEKAAHIALRTQQVIAHESGVTLVVDPLGGSHYVEALTSELEQRALSLIEKIDAVGGMVAAIEHGVPQAYIEEAAYALQTAIESKARIVVGVNAYVNEAAEVSSPRALSALEEAQRAAVVLVRAERDAQAAHAALVALRHAASGTDNLLPAIITCARALCTLGEIAQVLREVFGEYRP